MQKIENWSNRELAAQCVVARIDTDKFFDDNSYYEQVIGLIRKGIGGFCVFQGNTKIVKQMIEHLQSISNVPLIFMADFENGLQMRLEDGTSFPHALALGVGKDADMTRKVASAIAKEAKELGIDWNLAPVCDINSNPRNPIINIRSFGSEPALVAEHSNAYINGSQSEKAVASAKHFPGHGDTATDSHIELPILDKSLSELQSIELVPFREAINCGVKSIMVGHLLVPQLDPDLPASLSKIIIGDVLKGKMGFDGIVLTDALDMESVANKYASNVIATMALDAGNDIALMPREPNEAIDGLADELRRSPQLRQKAIKSVEKIYALKRFCGLIPSFAKPEAAPNTWIKHLNLALQAAIGGVVSRCPLESLPIDTSKQFAAFAILQNDVDMQAASRFFTMLAQATENDCDFGYIDTSIDANEIDRFKQGVSDADFIIFAIFARGRAYQGSIELSEKLVEIVDGIASGRKAYIIIFGNPYIKKELPSKNIIYAHSDSFPSLAAAIMTLTGRQFHESSEN